MDTMDILIKDIRRDAVKLTPEQKIEAYKNGDYKTLYLSLAPLILKYATGFGTGRSTAVAEYFSVGVEGFMVGCTNGCFDPEKGSFNTYIVYYIRGKMLRLRKKLQKQELSESDTSANFCEIPANGGSNKSQRLLEAQDFVNWCVKTTCLTPAERYVLLRYYAKRETIPIIAARFGVSKQRISQVKTKAVLKLKQNRSTCAVMATK